MEFHGGKSSPSSDESSSSFSVLKNSDQDDQMMMEELRRGPWTIEEDFALINYISNHGEGRWNSLSRCAGLKRTGKSCRLRWLNYLRPDVRRGNITLEEQLLILDLHFRYGNRWSKIAQHLPGRTDNEIKNYWRTRVQKHARQLKCDVNSKQFKDAMKYVMMPRLVEKIQAATTATPPLTGENYSDNSGQVMHMPLTCNIDSNNNIHDLENSTSITSSCDSFGAQVSPIFDLTDKYDNCFEFGYVDCLTSPCGYFNNSPDVGFRGMEQSKPWFGQDNLSDNLLSFDDIWFV